MREYKRLVNLLAAGAAYTFSDNIRYLLLTTDGLLYLKSLYRRRRPRREPGAAVVMMGSGSVVRVLDSTPAVTKRFILKY